MDVLKRIHPNIEAAAEEVNILLWAMPWRNRYPV
jgi:hypothetical protein